MKRDHPLMKPIFGALVELPSPSNISFWWNYGSLLGLCLSMQILSGLFLAMHYSGDISLAFSTIAHISRDVNFGWVLRVLHANSASLFFIALYLHIGRGMYYNSYIFHPTWSVGVFLLLAVMATSFLGYVLPWGQMSFWGASVITNLFSAIPYIGSDIVGWLWGGFAVDNATLTRFFALHFLLPFLVLGLVLAHLIFLHETGSSNPLGTSSHLDKMLFHSFYSFKDLTGVFTLLLILISLSLFLPWALGDPENFIPSNPMVSPIHIQPEWYFLFAYAVLRSIPNKLGGVMALVGAVMILFIMPLMPKSLFLSSSFIPLTKLFFWSLVGVFCLLTWLGARPVETPYILTSQILTFIYFFIFISFSPLQFFWNFSSQ